MAYPNITTHKEAKEMGWLKEPYKSNDFLRRYNEHQPYFGRKRFVCRDGEELPKYLIKANLRGASLVRADLVRANLIRADLTRADLTDADLTGSIIDKVSLLNETDKWHGADFTNVILAEPNDNMEDILQDPALKAENIKQSREIIIERMIELNISYAEGLGNYWEEYQQSLNAENIHDTDSEPGF